ncbi:family 3 encapsulin nanocompartment shell protein [Pseudonocardia sp. TRM90224]|uniref:family 3 encapsulin nanocompartment shell protein n=1 Tax=Pseudonocardia sp. TRM90224 TaxID=2812678 RepID=UPI001E6348F2|nr:family 3 encapsulin nanocompartment shell protein [Pseudonocardia sp. TRM90224]
MTETLSAPDLDRTPGQAFAAEITPWQNPDGLVMHFDKHLPAAFPLFASRPRYPVRHLLKTATVPDAPATFVHEPPRGALGAAGTSYRTTPEAAFAPRLAQTPLTDLVARVPVPAGLLDHPELLAQFIDFRVLVRLSVVENQSLLTGTADGSIVGLLNLPGARRTDSPLDMERAIIQTAAEVEETGGSCDGIVAHPFAYWEMVRTGLLSRLQVAGITVSRTRMIPRDRILMGDFKAAFTLLLPGVAHIKLLRGAGGDVIEASSRIGLAVHLPQHLMTLSWAADDE